MIYKISETGFIWYQIPVPPTRTLLYFKPHAGMHLTEKMILHFFFNLLSLASIPDIIIATTTIHQEPHHTTALPTTPPTDQYYIGRSVV